jgi:hypothetical protein
VQSKAIDLDPEEYGEDPIYYIITEYNPTNAVWGDPPERHDESWYAQPPTARCDCPALPAEYRRLKHAPDAIGWRHAWRRRYILREEQDKAGLLTDLH